MGWENGVPEDIALCLAHEFQRPELINAFQQLVKTYSNRPKSMIVELNTYRKYIPMLIQAYIKISEVNRKATMQVDRCTSIEYDRANKRWSKEEDEELINRCCDGKHNIHQLSNIFGRSPGAIQTHISDLVGRKRLSQEVAGKFIGIIDGKTAEAEICGTVYK